jgi:hypothetical protein
MIRLLLRDGMYREVPEAETAAVEDNDLVLRTTEGWPVLRMDRMAVTAYGNSSALDPARHAEHPKGEIR